MMEVNNDAISLSGAIIYVPIQYTDLRDLPMHDLCTCTVCQLASSTYAVTSFHSLPSVSIPACPTRSLRLVHVYRSQCMDTVPYVRLPYVCHHHHCHCHCHSHCLKYSVKSCCQPSSASHPVQIHSEFDFFEMSGSRRHRPELSEKERIVIVSGEA